MRRRKSTEDSKGKEKRCEKKKQDHPNAYIEKTRGSRYKEKSMKVVEKTAAAIPRRAHQSLRKKGKE